MAPETANRPLGPSSEGNGIPLISLVLTGALRIRPPQGERPAEPPRDD